jgi:hypothetical protein
MPPRAGSGAGSTGRLRFKGSANAVSRPKTNDSDDSLGRKMAFGGGFYEAW